MKKLDVISMTNRELFTEYNNCLNHRKNERYYNIIKEMAKRINRSLITLDVPMIFSQYKLNGAGDQRF